MTETDKQQEALARARSFQSMSNYVPIYEGFSRMGIPIEEIKPRENVFTFKAWKALGRYVRRGEHGVKVVTFIECKDRTTRGAAEETGKRSSYRRPWTTTVFHITQTEPITSPAPEER